MARQACRSRRNSWARAWSVLTIFAIGFWVESAPAAEPLEFRSFFISYDATNAQGAPRDGEKPGGQLAALDGMMRQYRDEGFNVMMWFNSGELNGIDGSHALIRHARYPEAREVTPAENEKKIAELQWLFARAKSYGMKNFIYFNLLQYTPAFARAHGLDKPAPISPTVHPFQHGGYGGNPRRTNLGVRNERTRAYTEAVFQEFLEIYRDLDGFYGCMGETVPGKRSSFFKEAIVPALKNSGRRPVIIAHQWQVPLPDYLEDIAPKEVYDNTWLGFHAYNSEQITDAAPYPGLVMWARTTALPTVAALYPANIKHFPFNSPRLAFEITHAMKRIPNFKGFMFWNFPGPHLGELFQKGLGRYASRDEEYSDEPWLALLTDRFGDRRAAERLLKAYNLSGYIVPETCALVYNGSDFFPRELAIPYYYLNGTWSRPWMTSPARAGLIPVDGYAKCVAQNPEHYKERDGSDWTKPPYKQEVVWGSEGGSLFDVTPSAHMRNVRRLGEECFAEARAAMPFVRKNRDVAQRACDFMEAYSLFARHYERKVAAAVSALIFAYGGRSADRLEAEKLADEALATYIEAATFYMKRLEGAPELLGRKGDFPARIEAERKDRQNLGVLFRWPDVAAKAKPLSSPTGAPAAVGPLQQGATQLKFQNGSIEWVSLADREGFAMVPHHPEPGRHWVWISPLWLAVTKDRVNGAPGASKVEYEWYVERLLERGFHVVGFNVGTSLGSPAGARAFDEFYDVVRQRFGLHAKARLIGQSNGGLIAFGWAFRHPEKVDRIVGIMPALDLKSWPKLEKVVGPDSIADPTFGYGRISVEELRKRLPDLNPIENLAPLAREKVEILLVHGDKDGTVLLEPNTLEAERRYRKLGGKVEVVVVKDAGHSPGAGFYDSQRVVDMLTR